MDSDASEVYILSFEQKKEEEKSNLNHQENKTALTL